MFVAVWLPYYVCSLFIEIKRDPKDRGTASYIYRSDGPLVAAEHPCVWERRLRHSQACFQLRSHQVRRSVCVVCTASCLVELDLIQGLEAILSIIDRHT
jgi:hypothetical protein